MSKIMQATTIVIELGLFILFLFIQLAREYFEINKWNMKLRPRNNQALAAIVVILSNLPDFFSVARDDPYALLESGLSTSNIINATCSVLVFSIGIYLIATKRHLKFDIFTGPSFWVATLLCLYLISTFWSIFPQGTLFRALELIGYYIVGIYIFTGGNPLSRLYWILFLQISLAILSSASWSSHEGRYFGILESNQHSLYSAVFLLLHYHLYPSSIVGYIYGLLSFIAFGSTSTAAALLAAIITYAIYGRPKSTLYLFRAPIIVAISSGYIIFIFFATYFSGIIEFIAPLLQKDEELFYTATGRTEIWKVYFDNYLNVPFGSGFYSERVWLDLMATSSFGAYFIPKNPHNGFLSAWIGGGFLALLSLCAVYLSTIKHLQRQPILVRRIGYAMLTMLLINSLTYPGIGGSFSMWYYALAVVIVLSNLQPNDAVPIAAVTVNGNSEEAHQRDWPCGYPALTASNVSRINE